MQEVRKIEHVGCGERASGEAATASGPVVVLSPAIGTLGRSSVYVEAPFAEGRIVLVPCLHLEQVPAIHLVSGTSFLHLFQGCSLATPDGGSLAQYIMGDWVFWENSRPDILDAGFVVGTTNYTLDSAIKALKQLISAWRQHEKEDKGAS